MKLVPENIQPIGEELAIRCNDAKESFLHFEAMRRACPCAGCQGEPDVIGYVDRPHVTYDPARSFRLRSYAFVGGYALQPTWEDGHATGIYSFDLLRRLGEWDQQPQVA